MPAAAGWTVGIIATLSLIASVSPGIRWVIKEPREFVNDYIFNFPDTSFAWAFVLALAGGGAGGPQAHRVVDPGRLHGRADRAGTSATSSPATRSVMDDIGEVIGLAFHVAAILFLLLARKEFWAKVRRGALVKAAAARWSPAWRSARSSAGRLLELFPERLAREDRFLYALNRVSRVRGRRL